jgi:methenyltetrahydromethanopterin cyclohydrolase
MTDTAGRPAGRVANREGLPSVNRLAQPLVEDLLTQATALRVGVERLENGVQVVDAGIRHTGGIEAGRRIAEICLGGLGRVAVGASAMLPGWPFQVEVHTADPVLACLASQYAGWSLAHKEGDQSFQALGSGPGRALAGRETLFEELGYRDSADRAVLVMEVDSVPPLPVVEKISRDCGVPPEAVTLILTPTRSLAGTVQVVARSLEVALHKAHALGFPLEQVVDGAGCAPLPPPAQDFLTAMGRTNDAILFGGQVQLYVRGSDADAGELARQLPSSASRDYGKPFAQIFSDYGHDFFQIDPMLFSPAYVLVTALESGRTYRAGALAPQLLEQSFYGA